MRTNTLKINVMPSLIPHVQGQTDLFDGHKCNYARLSVSELNSRAIVKVNMSVKQFFLKKGDLPILLSAILENFTVHKVVSVGVLSVTQVLYRCRNSTFFSGAKIRSNFKKLANNVIAGYPIRKIYQASFVAVYRGQ